MVKVIAVLGEATVLVGAIGRDSLGRTFNDLFYQMFVRASMLSGQIGEERPIRTKAWSWIDLASRRQCNHHLDGILRLFVLPR